MTFSYLIDKIAAAPMLAEPFAHVEIGDFFTPAHLDEITRAPEIDIGGAANDEDLFARLFAEQYRIIPFPGCITDRDQYVRWHQTRQAQKNRNNSACEGFGVTLRLMAPRSPLLAELHAFLQGEDFRAALMQKFALPDAGLVYDMGIQKYLDGYEISPHPDIRRKALTFMVNINPGAESESREHHTHYLELTAPRRYVQAFWDGNPDIDRCWVPWDWCETKKVQRRNNSIVIFSPGNRTLHGVKARYDHLPAQRTQLYGNLWYPEQPAIATLEWEDFDFKPSPKKSHHGLRAWVPPGVKKLVRRVRALNRNISHDHLKLD